jgi:hypothetical protein
VMFAAMAWHLIGMMVKMAQMSEHGMGEHAGHTMAGSGDVVAWVGLPFMAALLWMGLSALVDLVRPQAGHASGHVTSRSSGEHAAHVPAATGCHDPRPAGSVSERAHAAMGAAMNLGMFWMSVGLVAGLLPFLAVLQA